MNAAEGGVAVQTQREAVWLITAGAALLALCAGYYLAEGPAWLGADFDLRSPIRSIGLIAGVCCIVAIFIRPERGLLMMAAFLYTNASEPLVEKHGFASALQFLLLVTAAAKAVELLRHDERGERQLVVDPVLAPLVCYGAVLFLSSLVAARIGLSDGALSEHLKGILIFLVVTNIIRSPRMLRRIVWVLVLSGAFLGTISVFQVLTGAYAQEFAGFGHVKIAEVVLEVREPRIAGSLSDPNFYAQILVMIVPLALYRLWDEPSPLRKAVAGYALAVCMAAAVFTYSRGGAIALGLVLLLALLHRRIRPKFVLLGLLAVVPFALSLPQGFTGRLDTLVQFGSTATESVLGREDSSFRDRRRLMAVAWEMFSDHPVLGVGAGNFSENFDPYADHIGMSVSSFEKFGRQHFPHNLYLQIAAETGIAGLIAFASIIAATLMSLRMAYRSFIRSGATHTAHMVVSISLALVAYLTTSLFLHGAYIRYLWLVVAISASAAQVARRAAPSDADV